MQTVAAIYSLLSFSVCVTVTRRIRKTRPVGTQICQENALDIMRGELDSGRCYLPSAFGGSSTAACIWHYGLARACFNSARDMRYAGTCGDLVKLTDDHCKRFAGVKYPTTSLIPACQDYYNADRACVATCAALADPLKASCFAECARDKKGYAKLCFQKLVGRSPADPGVSSTNSGRQQKSRVPKETSTTASPGAQIQQS